MVLGTQACPSSSVEYCMYKESLSVDKQVKQRKRQGGKEVERLVSLCGDGWKKLDEWSSWWCVIHKAVGQQ